MLISIVICRLFLNGLTYPIERLFPTVEFPVSRGTPMIAPLIKWDHTEDYFVTKFSMQKGSYSGERKVTLSLEEENYIAGHIIDGRLLDFFIKLSNEASFK